MVKRASDTAQRPTADNPPSKRTRNRGEPDTTSGTNDVATRATARSSAAKGASKPQGTEPDGPTTPQEWANSDEEAEGDWAVVNTPTTATASDTAPATPSTKVDTQTSHGAVPRDGNPTPQTVVEEQAPGCADDAAVLKNVVDSSTSEDTAPDVSADAPSTTQAAHLPAQVVQDVAQAPAPATLAIVAPSTPAFVAPAPPAMVEPGPTVPNHPGLNAALIVNPTLDEVKNLFLNIDYVPDGDKRRMLGFAQKADDTNLRYAVSQVPARAKWGSSPKTAKLLCIDEKPITVWAVGDVETTWFRDLSGNPHDRVNIGFRLPFVNDEDGLKRLYGLARPARELDSVVYASKRMVVYRKGESMPDILPFNNFFDARKRFQAKSQMAKLEPSAIGKRDVVLIEGKFTRWNAAKDKRAKREWRLWGAGFELEAISLLYEAPPGVDPAPSEEVAEIDDDM